MVCTFFGHRDAPSEIQNELRSTVVNLIENNGVDRFYVGNQGNFDRMAKSILKSIQNEYPQIQYSVVLPYIPRTHSVGANEDYSDTVFPESLECTPPKFAISKRNKWLVEHSDIVITYVRHSWGGAAQYKALAERKGKKVINLL